MAYEKESLHDMIYGENHKLADSMPYNDTLDKLYGFPKEMHTGLEIENDILLSKKQITAFLQSHVQHLISKLLQLEKPTFPFLQNE